jgi:hypothetical protein
LASLREHRVYLENLRDGGESSFELLTRHARQAGEAFGCEHACLAELVLINEPWD